MRIDKRTPEMWVARRMAALAAGLCYQCRKRELKPGGRYCAICIERAGERRDALRQIRSAEPLLCTRCGRGLPSSEFRWCEVCRAKKNQGRRGKGA